MRVNGDLEFLVAGAGELKNAVIESLASDPGAGVVAGRIYYNTTDVICTIGTNKRGKNTS